MVMVVLGDEAAAKAVAEKDIGNSYYKKKEFDLALEKYNHAIELDPTNITFYTNKAAVFFEQGEHEKCRETCLVAVNVGRRYNSDSRLIAKALCRIGNSFLKQKSYKDATEFFQKSLSEHPTQDVQQKVCYCKKEIKEQERIAYINPDIALEEKLKGDDALKIREFESALNHYDEAIKRNPSDAKLYLDRAAVHMKLGLPEKALPDCDHAIKQDSKLAQGHICKGAALESMEEYDIAVDCYNKALDLDPIAKEATEALHRCLDKDYRHRNTPKSIYERAAQHQEMKRVFPDPNLDQLISEINDDPNAILKYSSDPVMMQKLRKLIEFGFITTV